MKKLHRGAVGSLFGTAACIGTLLVVLSDQPLADEGPPVTSFHALHTASPYGGDDLMLATQTETEEFEYVKADSYTLYPFPVYRKVDVYSKDADGVHTAGTKHEVIEQPHVVSEKHILQKKVKVGNN